MSRAGRLLANYGWALLNIVLGLALGGLLLEATLQLNPQLLLRGMGAPGPIERPLQTLDYTVRLSDADLFFWHRALIRPIAAGADEVEAQVHFTTDELGFPNPVPSAPHSDVVVLGRSFSLGAQAAEPWPRRLEAMTGLQVTNLSQAANGIESKRTFLRRFGLPRQPRWVIVDVLPSMDILGAAPASASLVAQLPVPLVQTLARRVLAPTLPAALAAPIYPLSVNLGPRSADLVFFSYYLAALSVSPADLAASQDWQAYQTQLLALAADARAGGACVALLYAPTKEETYVPLAASASSLAPILEAGWSPWALDLDGRLRQDPQLPVTVETLQERALAARLLVRAFAAEQGLPFIDPSDDMRAAALTGRDPYLRYDSHWSALGHALVAEHVAAAIAAAPCP
jgi:hypothetical protein